MRDRRPPLLAATSKLLSASSMSYYAHSAQAIPDRIPAAASGTMNNLTIGGIDPRTGKPFAYYETIAGGMGARPSKAGVSGVHTHMTNSLNTPAEALEYAYPLRVRQYSLRPAAAARENIAAAMESSARLRFSPIAK